MYKMMEKESVVRIPPNRLGEDIDILSTELTRSTFEGKIDNRDGLNILVTDVARVGEGRIVHGDGGVYQNVRYNSLPN